MKQGLKTLGFALLMLLVFIMIYNIFSGPPPTQTGSSNLSQIEETPYWFSILVSWLPMLIMIIFYILFLHIFRSLLNIGERIATALERNGTGQKASIEEQ